MASTFSETETRVLSALAFEDDYYLAELGTPGETREALKRLVRETYVALYARDQLGRDRGAASSR